MDFWTFGLLAITLLLSGCGASPSLVSIQITPDTASIVNSGGTVQFTAMGTYSRGKHPSETRDVTSLVTWSSSNTGTATISNSGVATAVSSGTTSITATMNSSNGLVSANASLDVSLSGSGGGTAPPGTRDLTAITLIPNALTINGIGNAAQFTAMGTFSAAPTTEILTNVTWQSTNTSVATISGSGLATAVACPTSSCNSTITATGTAQSGATIIGTGQLTVVPSGASGARDLTAVTIIPGSQVINGSGSEQFLALGTFNAAPTSELLTTVTWQSSNASVATISTSGLATAGTCATSSCSTTITAATTAPSGAIIIGQTTLTVSPPPTTPVRDLTGISLIPSNGSVLGIGNSAKFVAQGLYSASPTAAQLATVQWQSSNPSVATIDPASGVATAVACTTGPCITFITATATAPVSGATIVGFGQLAVSPAPTASDLTGITLAPATQSVVIPVGQTASITFQALGTFSGTSASQLLTNVTWASNNTAVASFAYPSKGLVTANNCPADPCVATITATATAPVSGAQIVGQGTLTVDAAAPAPVHDLTAIALVPSTATVTGIGSTLQLTPIGTYSTAPTAALVPLPSISWLSSDPTVATVSSPGGLVTAVACATVSCPVTITATAPDANGNPATATAQLTVVPTPPTQAQAGQLTSLSVTPVIQNLDGPGETAQFIATGTFDTTPTLRDLTKSPQLQWASSNTGIANVDSLGVATSLKTGTTTITATYTNTNNVAVSASAVLNETGTGNGTVTPSLTISVIGTGTGAVASSPGGITACTSSGGTCSSQFVLGSTVTLTATPSGGSTFAGWSSNCTPVGGNPNQCTITMGGNQSVGAIFN